MLEPKIYPTLLTLSDTFLSWNCVADALGNDLIPANRTAGLGIADIAVGSFSGSLLTSPSPEEARPVRFLMKFWIAMRCR